MVDTMSALESSVLKNVPVEIMQSIFEYINASDDEVYGRGVGMQSLGAALTCRDFTGSRILCGSTRCSFGVISTRLTDVWSTMWAIRNSGGR